MTTCHDAAADLRTNAAGLAKLRAGQEASEGQRSEGVLEAARNAALTAAGLDLEGPGRDSSEGPSRSPIGSTRPVAIARIAGRLTQGTVVAVTTILQLR